MNNRIFLDYNSSTPVDPLVIEKMHLFHSKIFGNVSSLNHFYGKKAKNNYSVAKKELALGLNCSQNELIFTSGATESINLAIKGTILSSKNKFKEIVTCTSEHKAVLDTCSYLENYGVKVKYIDVDLNGFVDIKKLSNAITKKTTLVAILHGNNEIGAINPIGEIGLICKKNNVPFFVDAAQTFGKIPIDVESLNISMLAGSAHKIYGPKGIGILYKKKSIKLEPLIHGGGQENNLRAGTINLPGVIGFAEAFKIINEKRETENQYLNELSNIFIEELKREKISFKINGPKINRLPGNLNIAIKNVDSDWLITMIPEISIAKGSACSSETIQPSHVLRAIGLDDKDSESSIRISFGRFTKKSDAAFAAKLIAKKSQEYLLKKEVFQL